MKTNAKVLISLVVLGLCVMGCACASEEIPPFMKDAFRAVDKNADRVISPEEAKVIGGPLHVTLERFKAADTNGDHRLNLAECHAAKLWAPPPSGSVVVPPVVGSTVVVPPAGGPTVVVPPPAGRAIVGPHGPNTPIARDIREDARDRREDIADRREDIRDRQEDRIDALHDGGRADRLEDIRDRQEDIRDRNEDRRDRAEDRHDRNHGAPPRGHR